MSLILAPATREDAATIARIWVTAFDNPNDRINLTKYGTVDRKELIASLVPFIEKEIETLPDSPYLVVKDKESGEVISYAQWEFPDTSKSKTGDSETSGNQVGNLTQEEHIGGSNDGCYDGAPSGFNFSFLPEYYERGEKLLNDTVKGRPHFSNPLFPP
jgi:hypothetical protein